MGQAQFNVYQQNVLSLARSMVIKSSLEAQAVNTALTTLHDAGGGSRYAVDASDPTTWRYYLNLAGRYAPSDTPMQVISQDSLQTIDFTVANLQTNTATAAAYAVGSYYYQELVEKYPGQSRLIRGILNPVDMATAIAAPEGAVLWMDPTLVEPQEMNLEVEISRWCAYWFRRWNVPAYSLTDDLYVAAMLGVMYSQLPLTILKIRLQNCHTYMTHSFHMLEHLESNGELNQYGASLTTAQLLWLYRNIRYIQRNPGKQSTFQWLVQNILTARNLPLSSWIMRHNTAQLQESQVATPLFVRNNINNLLSEGGISTRTVTAMLAAETPMARDNGSDADTVRSVTSTLALSLDDTLNTKVLESSVIDTTDASPYKLADCLLNHWLYFATTGIYTAFISVQDPKTGDNYSFSARDAFLVYMYCFAAGMGLPLTTIPPLIASKVRKIPTPSAADILPYLTGAVDPAIDLPAVFRHQPVIARQYISIESFNAAVSAIHQGELYHHALFSTQGHTWTRAQMEFATLFLWTDYGCDLGTGQSFAEWFSSRNLDIPSLTQTQLATLANALVIAATGADVSKVESLANIQAAMLGIMTQLSSYTVQYIAAINTTPIIEMEHPSIRLGDVLVETSDDTYIEIDQVTIQGVKASGTIRAVGLVDLALTAYQEAATGEATYAIDQGVDVICSPDAIVNYKVPIRTRLVTVTDNVAGETTAGLELDLSEYRPTPYQSLPVVFSSLQLNFYPALNAQDKAVMKQRYFAYLDANGTPSGLLSFFLPNTILPPLYPSS